MFMLLQGSAVGKLQLTHKSCREIDVRADVAIHLHGIGDGQRLRRASEGCALIRQYLRLR